ncbi:hypothetical protein BV25DRAFT_504427 [Artomyces pyxidatus]|uniref:Uncharacterized protein n=1 Tax=Artomyces pyxidatus TaxID=48021 RepID=A0ACB8THX7_9AGAM|nr:hypothetical protein BV25DRAFT_504427 [Artomyces pyxidatus]
MPTTVVKGLARTRGVQHSLHLFTRTRHRTFTPSVAVARPQTCPPITGSVSDPAKSSYDSSDSQVPVPNSLCHNLHNAPNKGPSKPNIADCRRPVSHRGPASTSMYRTVRASISSLAFFDQSGHLKSSALPARPPISKQASGGAWTIRGAVHDGVSASRMLQDGHSPPPLAQWCQYLQEMTMGRCVRAPPWCTRLHRGSGGRSRSWKLAF